MVDSRKPTVLKNLRDVYEQLVEAVYISLTSQAEHKEFPLLMIAADIAELDEDGYPVLDLTQLSVQSLIPDLDNENVVRVLRRAAFEMESGNMTEEMA